MSHYLCLLLSLPTVGALTLLCVSRRNEDAIKWLANGVALGGFLFSTPLWSWYNPKNPDFQLIERARWIPSIGAEYFLGIDGISALFILLTSLIGFIAMLSSWRAITERVKEYYVALLVLQTALLGAFMSLDFLLFFFFWMLTQVPMYFLIRTWGSGDRRHAGIIVPSMAFLDRLERPTVVLFADRAGGGTAGLAGLFAGWHEVARIAVGGP